MNRPLIIGIAGGSGSGKTYLAREISEAVQGHVSVLSMDQYFRDTDTVNPHNVNFDHPAHLDFALMMRHLKMLRSGKSVNAPSYDFKSMRRTPHNIVIRATRVIIFEGLFALAEPVASLCDITCFLNVATDERLLGRILRDTRERGATIEGVVDRYQRFVRPSYAVFVEPTKQNADIVVDFTYRRSLFSKLLTHLITDTISAQIDPDDFVAGIRQQGYSVGANREGGYMPLSIDILRLAKAYPESVMPFEPDRTLLASPAFAQFQHSEVDSKHDRRTN